jgi:hypothetical protein
MEPFAYIVVCGGNETDIEFFEFSNVKSGSFFGCFDEFSKFWKKKIFFSEISGLQ